MRKSRKQKTAWKHTQREVKHDLVYAQYVLKVMPQIVDGLSEKYPIFKALKGVIRNPFF